MASSANFAARAGGSARLRLIGLMAGVGAFALLAAAAQPGAAQNVPAAPSALAAPPNPNAGLSAAAAAATPILQEGVAAVVNDEIISTYDLRQRVLLLVVTSGVQVTEESLPQFQRQALGDLIDERLQLQEISGIEGRTKTKLMPTPKEVDDQIDRMAQQNGLTGAQMLATLATAGVGKETLAAQLRAGIAWQRYVGGRFGSEVKIGDDQIDAALKRAETASSKPQYLAAEIFIDAQRAGGEEAALEGARQLETQIQQGAPFASVARQFSSAPSASSGGDAGWMVSGDISPAVEDALQKLRPGQLSPPVPVAGGAYILLLRDKRSGQGATMVSLKQAAVRLATDAPPGEVEAATAKLAALRPQITNCDTMEAQAAKVDGVVAGDLGEADLNDLSETFRTAISTLQVGQVSAPVRTNAGMHLVALCGRRNAGAAQLTRDDVENRLTDQELAMIAKRELRDLRNSASIDNR